MADAPGVCAVMLADTIVELSNTRRDRNVWRLIAVQGIHHIHDQRIEIERLRQQLAHLRDEYRDYRAATIGKTGRAA